MITLCPPSSTNLEQHYEEKQVWEKRGEWFEEM